MAVASKLTTIINALQNIKNAIIAKGSTPTGNLTTWASAISAIDTVKNTNLTVTPKTTTQNLTPSSNYTGYGRVTVQPVTSSIDSNIVASNIKQGVTILGVSGSVVPSTISVETDNMTGTLNFILNAQGALENIQKTDDSVVTTLQSSLSSTENIKNYANTNIKFISFRNITTCSFNFGTNSNFNNCTSLLGVDFSSLKTISSSGSLEQFCKGCTNLKTFDLSKLESAVSSRALSSLFWNCSHLLTMSFPKLSVITEAETLYYCFKNCIALTDVYFNSLKTTSFGSYNNQFNFMLDGCSNVKLHFPSNLQTIIQNQEQYDDGFMGTDTAILFDLTATS